MSSKKNKNKNKNDIMFWPDGEKFEESRKMRFPITKKQHCNILHYCVYIIQYVLYYIGQLNYLYNFKST